MEINLEPTMDVSWMEGFGQCGGDFHVTKPKMMVVGAGAQAGLPPFECSSADGKKCVVPMKQLMKFAGIASLDDPVAGTAGKSDYYSAMVDVNGYKQSAWNKACNATANGPSLPSFCFRKLFIMCLSSRRLAANHLK